VYITKKMSSSPNLILDTKITVRQKNHSNGTGQTFLTHCIYELNQKSPDYTYEINTHGQLPNVQFYLGMIECMSRGNTGKLHEILAWSYDNKEEEHGFIQWLFPNFPINVKFCGQRTAIHENTLEIPNILKSIETSIERTDQGDGTNSLAYAFNEEEVKIFSSSAIIKSNLIQSLVSILAFWGFTLSYNSYYMPIINKSNDYLIRMANIYHHPHNYLRITRVLKCLLAVGLLDHACAFFEALFGIYKEGWCEERSMMFYCEVIGMVVDVPDSITKILMEFRKKV